MSPSAEILITTTDVIQGFRVKEYLGIVTGNAEERTKESRQEVSRGMPYFPIGNSQGIELVHWRKACDLMIRSAKGMGANAVIGVTYINSPKVTGNEYHTDTSVETICYGTAVIIEPS